VIDQTGESLECEADPVPYSEGDRQQDVWIVAKDVGAEDDVVFRVAQLREMGSADAPAVIS
jgi:hypothetical protein